MPNALKQYAEARPTPRNKLMGLLADTLTRANEYATLMDPRYENKRQNQTLGLLADAVQLGSLAKTADRMSYGEPLTNVGKANVPFLKPETADALMMAPLSPRNALAMMGAGMGDNGMMKAATVWHGSPHKFDKFDASKIGTGEGAQAYGHGLYLAEAPDVAKSYRTAGGTREQWAANELSKGTPEADVRGWIELWEGVDAKAAQAMVDRAKAMGAPEGNLYKVDLPDDAIARMLDWDKPLSQQPEALAALNKIADRLPRNVVVDVASGRKVKSSLTGADFYNRLSGNPDPMAAIGPRPVAGRPIVGAAGVPGIMEYDQTGQAAASRFLRESSVPGIRYLDGGSRDTGNGTSNFVVFPGNEGLLSILERNGQPLR